MVRSNTSRSKSTSKSSHYQLDQVHIQTKCWEIHPCRLWNHLKKKTAKRMIIFFGFCFQTRQVQEKVFQLTVLGCRFFWTVLKNVKRTCVLQDVLKMSLYTFLFLKFSRTGLWSTSVPISIFASHSVLIISSTHYPSQNCIPYFSATWSN